ncbi:hypothetical protein QUF54_05335 [Candidatus Marithioploca araucensis]|uniref:Uncharacterized protein n=1 Tax=Candidatus Marithioploca araucensis TaxID=70273 RepID=A0ABT7VT73_9GAMM|nr:hypothetical protein [Candidatus Marithioploca araucensis]
MNSDSDNITEQINMPAIDFNCYASSGIIKIPESDRDWYDKPITVVLLRQESTNTPITKRSLAL